MLLFCSINFPVCATKTLCFPKNFIQQNGLQSNLRKSCKIYKIQLWDIATGSLLTSIKGENNPENVLAFSPDNKILASGSQDGTIQLWNVATGNKLSTLKGHVDWVNALVFSADGNTLASGSQDGAIFLWNVPH